MRYGMVIDLKKCIGCYACAIACKAENATPPGVLYMRISKHETGRYPNVRRFSIPILCMHCADPPCEKVCPTGATFKRSDNGVVMIDKDMCVGCRYCMMACPYGARYFHAEDREYFPNQGLTPYERQAYANHPPGGVEKCEFCSKRVGKGLQPACAANCPTRAMHFGDLDDPTSEISRLIAERAGFQLHPELGTDASVYYLPP